MVRAYRPLLKALDLTYLQYMVMLLLWEQSPLNVKQIGTRLNLDSGTLTPLLKRMEHKGLVTRSRGEQDERVRLISISKKGLALQNQAQSVPIDLARCIGLPGSRSQELKKLCQQVLDALKEQ